MIQINIKYNKMSVIQITKIFKNEKIVMLRCSDADGERYLGIDQQKDAYGYDRFWFHVQHWHQ